MYRTERGFVKAFTAKLRNAGFVVNRIESEGTGVGTPDLFVQGHGFDVWIECKNKPKASIYNKFWRIPYRPGQLAWAGTYQNTHINGLDGVGKVSLTVVAMLDGVLVAQTNWMSDIITQKRNDQFAYALFSWNDWKKVNKKTLHDLLLCMSQRLTLQPRTVDCTWIDFFATYTGLRRYGTLGRQEGGYCKAADTCHVHFDTLKKHVLDDYQKEFGESIADADEAKYDTDLLARLWWIMYRDYEALAQGANE